MIVKAIDRRIPELDIDAIEARYPGDTPDLFICRNTIPQGIPLERTILVLVEPPLADHRRWIYENFSKFHTVITHKSEGDNVFRFCDNPLLFPYGPYYGSKYKRESTKITTRKVHYAGMRSNGYCSVPNCYRSINLYPLRHEAGDWLLNNDLGYCFGLGWPNLTKNYPKMDIKVEYPDNWRMQKTADVDQYECDFMLSMENSMKEGYTSEKFHDPIMCQRVMMYLGPPEVTDYISDECFVDLRKYLTFDPDSYFVEGVDVKPSFRYTELRRLIADMSQGEYDTIVQNATDWQNDNKGMFEMYKDALTRFVMERIDG